jgi:hypothetical protein
MFSSSTHTQWERSSIDYTESPAESKKNNTTDGGAGEGKKFFVFLPSSYHETPEV